MSLSVYDFFYIFFLKAIIIGFKVKIKYELKIQKGYLYKKLRYNAKATDVITKKTYIAGGGMTNLDTAVCLAVHMYDKNITIFMAANAVAVL